MVKIVQTYINIHFTELIIGVLIFSIIVVIISIFYVIYSTTDERIIRKKNKKNISKIKKIKYTKQFLKRVDGIDLDLNVRKGPLK